MICLACKLFFRVINSRTIRFMYRQRDQDVHLKVLITLHDIICIFYTFMVVCLATVCVVQLSPVMLFRECALRNLRISFWVRFEQGSHAKL